MISRGNVALKRAPHEICAACTSYKFCPCIVTSSSSLHHSALTTKALTTATPFLFSALFVDSTGQTQYAIDLEALDLNHVNEEFLIPIILLSIFGRLVAIHHRQSSNQITVDNTRMMLDTSQYHHLLYS